MKKTLFILAVCFCLFGTIEAQNIWKPINVEGSLLGASSDGSLFARDDSNGLLRSQDEGATWQVVLGNETGFYGFINRSCFTVSPEGRIFVFNDSSQTVVYSDDNGDTWHPTSVLSLCGLPTKAGICAPTNNIIVVWANDGEIIFTTDGGETWDGTILEFLGEYLQVSDLIVNEAGDVYVGVWYYSGYQSGIYHSTLSDMQNWELAAFEGAAVQQLALHPDGSIVAGTFWGEIGGFQQQPGFYLIDAMKNEIAISDNGITYCLDYFITFEEITVVLAYSRDYGEHLHNIGEQFEVEPSGGGRDGNLYKGYDNYLYLFVNGQYYKSIQNADEIIPQHRPFAPLGAEWYFHVLSQWPITAPPFYYIRYAVTGMAEVQGHICSVIDDYYYVYEENNVVYWYNQVHDSFSVLYDFNAEAGASWYCDVEGFTCLVTVESVDSVTWNGHTYRTQYVTGYVPDEGFVIYYGRIIEGIGYEKGLFPHELVFDGTEYDYMRCYLEDGEMLYHEGNYDCDYVYVPNDGLVQSEWCRFSVYPNPTDGILNISVRLPQCDSPTVQTYRITNLMSQTVLSGNITAETQQIDVSGLPEGMYFVTVAGATRKFVVE